MSTTNYVNSVLSAAPQALLTEANHLAACLGESIADINTYRVLGYQDADGNLYAVINTAATNGLLYKAGIGSVSRPAYDTEEAIDLGMAQAALDATVIYMGGDAPVAQPDKITAYVNVDPQQGLIMMGLTPCEPSHSSEL